MVCYLDYFEFSAAAYFNLFFKIVVFMDGVCFTLILLHQFISFYLKIEECKQADKGSLLPTYILKLKSRPRASNGQRYPLPYRAHFGILKCAQPGKGYC